MTLIHSMLSVVAAVPEVPTEMSSRLSSRENPRSLLQTIRAFPVHTSRTTPSTSQSLDDLVEALWAVPERLGSCTLVVYLASTALF